ncbi:hypothetical protein [Bradyrhizobium sp. URHC0002]
MNINRDTDGRKIITIEVLATYKEARRLMASPIPADPTNRLSRQEAIRVASLELHLLLRRQPEQFNIFDTADDQMPAFVVRGGTAMMLDYQSAAAIRRRLEQIYSGYRREGESP